MNLCTIHLGKYKTVKPYLSLIKLSKYLKYIYCSLIVLLEEKPNNVSVDLMKSSEQTTAYINFLKANEALKSKILRQQ